MEDHCLNWILDDDFILAVNSIIGNITDGGLPQCVIFTLHRKPLTGKKIEQTTIKKLQELETKTAVYCDFYFKSWSVTQLQGSPIVCALCYAISILKSKAWFRRRTFCAEPNWISSTLEQHWRDIWFKQRTVCRTLICPHQTLLPHLKLIQTPLFCRISFMSLIGQHMSGAASEPDISFLLHVPTETLNFFLLDLIYWSLDVLHIYGSIFNKNM